MINTKVKISVGLFVIISALMFIYFAFQTGILRFADKKYSTYTISLADASGLRKKDDIKIAGVKVGWISDINLDQTKHRVILTTQVSSDYLLRSDAYALVRQDGILGGKYLEIVPGTPTLASLANGDQLKNAQETPATLDILFNQVHNIASDVQTVTSGLKNTLEEACNSKIVDKTLTGINQMITQLAVLTQSVQGLVDKNQSTIEHALQDISGLVSDLKKQLPEIVSSIKDITSKVSTTITPAIEKNIDAVSSHVTESVSRITDTITNTLDQTAQSVCQITKKINDGQGTLGKLINDDQTYKDLNVTVQCINKVRSHMEEFDLGLDTNIQAKTFGNIEGHFDAYIWPNQRYFLLAGFNAPSWDKFTHKKKHSFFREHDRWLFNLQLGMSLFCDNLRTRVGLFYNTIGAAFDWKIIDTDMFKWWTTFEAFDFKRHLRMKWLNRFFLFNDYIYFMCGFDDFINRKHSNFFVGAGLCLGHAY